MDTNASSYIFVSFVTVRKSNALKKLYQMGVIQYIHSLMVL